jgi:hypothetical protein
VTKKHKDRLFSPKHLSTLRLTGLGDDCDDLSNYYLDLVKRTRKSVVFGDLSEMTERRRASLTLDSIYQSSLARSINLVRGFSRIVGQRNTHSLALISRGHLETTALLGFLCDQLVSYEKKRLTFNNLHDKIAAVMLGHSGSDFAKSLKPINVMTMIEKADRHLGETIGVRDGGMILDCYGWLSNFGHPNFLSAASTFTLDSRQGIFTFGEGDSTFGGEKELLNYLLISCGIQSTFYDNVEKIRTRVEI